MTWPTPIFLTSDASYVDYRPAVNAAGDTVVFERTPVGGGATTLQVIDDFANPAPAPFLSGTSPLVSQTRPDWDWQNDHILLNGSASNAGPLGVWLVSSSGFNPRAISGPTNAAYPRWNRAVTQFVTENSGSGGGTSLRPCNTIFNIDGSLHTANVDGTDTSQVAMYGGMPAVAPGDLPLIAYAGQPAVPSWTGAVYDQNTNYIFLNTLSDGVFTSAPMEPGASMARFDPNYEGRAPAWSPDGTTIAFESNRLGGGFAIYLYNLTSQTWKQVTDPGLNGQHAEFFADGTKLIVCINHQGGTPATMGIAWIDISSLL